MEEVVYINKRKVDLGSSTPVRKIQIGDIGEVSKRKSSFSYSLKLPFTSNNKEIFEMLGTIGNASRKPFEKLVIDYVVNGVFLITNGSGKIRETADNYVLNIQDGIVDLGERLSGKKMTELPLSDLNHILTTQNYIDSMDNVEGYIYGIADFGLGIDTIIKVETQAPSIYTHTLFSRIFESIGLNLVGEFFNTNQKYLKETVTLSKGYEVSDIAFTDIAKGGVNMVEVSDNRAAKSPIEFEEVVDIIDNSLIGASVVGDKIVFAVAGVYKLSLSINHDSFSTFLHVKTVLNGEDIGFIPIALGTGSASGVITRDIVFTAAISDEIEFVIFGASGYESGNPDEIYILNYTVSGSFDLFLQDGGQLIEPVKYLSDLSQIEFVKDVIQRHGLLLHPIQESNDYRFKQFEQVLSSREDFEDWTDKLKFMGREKYESGYAKINKAVYQYPEEIVIPNNDGEMIVDNENAITEKPMISSVFEIPNSAGNLHGGESYLVPLWELKDSVVETRETPVKTLSIRRAEVNIEAALFAEVTTVSKNGNIPILSLDEMSMQFFLNNNYKSFKSLIENYKSRDIILNLTPIDIYNIDFFKLKFFKNTGRFYYLNNILNKAGKLSKVNMIEVFEFLQNEPPSQVGDYVFEMPHDSTRTITVGNLLTGYVDPELNEGFKVKISDGFNNDLVMKQNGIIISAEIEILLSELDLTIFDALGGLVEYSKQWTFTLSDKGSENYSLDTGVIDATVLGIVNVAPVADAGEDQETDLLEPDFTGNLQLFVNGGGSFDNTGNIISYIWEVQSKPVSSGISVIGVSSSPAATLLIPNETDSIGLYIIKLTVEDEFGLTDFDTLEVQINNYSPVN